MAVKRRISTEIISVRVIRGYSLGKATGTAVCGIVGIEKWQRSSPVYLPGGIIVAYSGGMGEPIAVG